MKLFRKAKESEKYLAKPFFVQRKPRFYLQLGIIATFLVGVTYFAVSTLAYRSTSTTVWTNTNTTVATGTITGGPTATVTLTPSSAGSLIYNSPPAVSTIAGRGGVATMFTPNVATTTSTISISPVVTGCTLGVNQVCQRGTITVQFSQPVANPVIHLVGLGGNGSSADFSAQMTLTGSSPAGASLGSVSSGATNLQVASDNTIRVINNNGVTSCGSGTSGAGCGSVQINGTVTSLTFNASILFANGSGTTSGTSRESYDITFTASEDFSDAPTTNFNSSQAPTHVIGDLRLGSTIDADNTTTADSVISPFPVAAGANNNGTNGDGADEDAISTFPTLTTASTSYSLTVPISGASKAGTVCGWIDFNRDNAFVATERACSTFVSGATSVALTWNSANGNAPTGLTAGNNYVRLRAGYTNAQIQTADGKGRADSGEVEDYQITITAAAPDLTITKSHTGNFTIGNTGTYSFTVNNIGNATSSGTITVTDTLPIGLTVNGGVAGGLTEGGTNAANWTCNSDAATPQTITCTSSTAIAVSGSSTFNFAVNVGANTAVGTNSITNTATVAGGSQTNTTNDSSSDPTTVVLPSFSCGSTVFESAGSSLYTVNTSTGAVTQVGVLSAATAAIAVQPSTGNVYYYNTVTTSMQLYVWNATTGTNTAIGSPINLGQGLPRLGFTPTGRLFTAGNNGGVLFLYEVNPSTGAFISSGAITSSSTVSTGSGDLVADSNGNLLLTANAEFYSVNPDTRVATLVSTMSVQPMVGLAFGGTGTLYGVNSLNNNFYSINPNTGVATLIGATIASSTDLGSCAFPTPILTSTKTVAKIVGSAGATIIPGDTLEYTITTTNSGTAPTTVTTLTDAIPAGTTYVTGSTRLNGTAVADISGVMPYVTANEIHGVGMNSGVIGSNAGTNNVATVVFRVTVNTSSPPTTVSNQGTINFANGTPVLTDDPSVAGLANPTVTDVVFYSISGKVFEDINYGGGEGRDLITAGGVVRPNARVELYDPSGNFVASTLTDAGGNYTFTGVSPGSYTVRVVNSTVTSSRSGYVPGLMPVQTFRTDYWGVAPFDVQRVGGENPALVDAGNGSTTLAALTTATTTAQSITTAVVTNANVADIDFGFNFDTIVNTNNSGQGSLRQFILNANALSNTGLAQVGLTAGRDTSIFMISNGADGFGLRSAFNYFSGGAATITISSSLPTVTETVTLDGTTQPGFSSAPIIEVSGANMPVGANNHILNFTASNNVVRKLVINRAGDDAIYAQNGSNGNLFVGNYIGVNVAGTAVVGNAADGIDVEGNNNTIGGLTSAESNLIGGAGNGHSGIEIGGGASASSGTVVIGNYIGTNPSGANLGNGGNGIEIRSTTGTTTIGGSSAGAPNVIARNAEVGVSMLSATGVFITQNSIYANGTLGIDIDWDAVTLNDANDADSGSNNKLNFPVFENIYVVGSNLTIVGCAPTGATIELFKTDISLGTAAVGANRLGKLQDYGEGQQYLTTLTEGSGSDTDSGTNCATDVDGNNQTGMNRFSFTIAIPSGVSVGTMLTSTATVSATGTSEFSPNYTLITGLPNVTLLKSCLLPANCTTTPQLPGTEVTYNIQFTNGGLAGAQNVVITDGIPANTDYKLGTATSNVGSTGLTIAIEYSADYDPMNASAATWTYTPVSGGGGASVGYDRLVKAIRWRVTTGVLSNSSPNNAGQVSFTTKIR